MKKNTILIRFVLAIMKFSGLQVFLIIFFSGIAMGSPSEILGQEILEKRLTLRADNQKIKDVLATIAKSVHNIKFSYNPQSTFVDKEVTVLYHDRRLGEILEEVLSQANLTFEVVGDYIVITEKKSETASTTTTTTTVEDKDFPISGTVKDEQGNPLPGVSIFVKGTTSGTTTDADGKYVFNVNDGTETLIFSFIGYSLEEIQIQGRNVIDLMMMPDIKSLQEVVVVGYGAVEKKDVTGAIGSLSSDVITKSTITDATGALKGRVAGVNVQQNAGKPGGSYKIAIRGVHTLNTGNNLSNNEPLFVIDGIPTTSGMTDLNPQDIEKMDILKDASATAIYGSRGANGVIIVTTKRGKAGRFTISYDGYIGERTPAHLPKMMNGPEYVQWRTDLYTRQNLNTTRSDLNPGFFTPEEWQVIDNQSYSNFRNIMLRNGLQTSSTITASGGDDKGTFAMSIGQLKEEGTVPGQDFNRYNIRLAIDRNLTEKWKTGGNIYFTQSIQNEGSYEALRSSYRMPPVAIPYNSDGTPRYNSYRTDPTNNPLFEVGKDGEVREHRRYRAFGNIYLQVEPIKGLTLRSQLSPQMIFNRDGESYGVNAKNGGHGNPANTLATRNTSDYFSYVWDNQLNYAKSIDKHNFTLSLIQSIQSERWEDSNQSSKGFPYSSLWYNLDAVPVSNVVSSGTDFRKATLASFTGRLNYSYHDKYLLTVTGRYDGSSKLAPGHKWSFFPSAALGWRISEEDFLKNSNVVDNLKLRLTYGVTGNNRGVDPYGTQSNIATQSPGGNNVYNYNYNGALVSGYYKTGLANPNLTWEKTSELNIGIDFGIIKSRINGSIDLYRRDTKDLIQPRQLPQTTGWTSITDNIGWVRNSGIEIALNSMNVQAGKFTWTTNLIFDSNKNEIVELYGQKKDDIGSRFFIGKPVLVNYDYQFDGIWQSDQAAEAAQYSQLPGQVRVKDIVADGVIDAKDRKVIGQQTPKWNASITNTFNYGNWDFSFYVYTRQGQQLNSGFVSSFMSLAGNYNQVNVSYWTESNPSNKIPQPGNTGKYFSTYYYRDVSFVRVGNISLGYSIPKDILNRWKISRLRVYASATNPFTFSSYPGFDPEWADQNTWGDATGYSTYLLGVNLQF